MATIFLILAPLPALYGVMVTGDLTQQVYKPTLQQIRFVLTNRWYLIGASVLLWAAGVGWHFLYAPASIWILVISTIFVILFIIFGFLMPGYILFPSLNQPTWISATQADDLLASDEPVIGLEINGDGRAYPIDLIRRPHMVNDAVGGEAVTMSYCMICQSAMAFKPELAGHKLRLMTPLQWENNLTMYNPSTEHLIQQLTAGVIWGPDEGQTVERYPTLIMPWAAWRKLHPDTKVLYHPPQHIFDTLIRSIFRRLDLQDRPIFPTISHTDARLPNEAEVLGVCVQDVCKAYPLTFLEQQPVINDDLNGKALVVAYDPKLKAGDVFHRQHDGQTLTFGHEVGADGTSLLNDEETGSKWDMRGLAIAGTLKGTQLVPYPHFSKVFWFGWVNFNPSTDVAS